MRRQIAPREIEVIDADLAAVNRQVEALGPLADRVDAAKRILSERLPRVERSRMYGELFRRDDGVEVQLRDPGLYERRIRAALAVLRGELSLLDNDFEILAMLNAAVGPRPDSAVTIDRVSGKELPKDSSPAGWRECLAAALKVNDIYEKVAALREERKSRLAGPGEEKPYLVVGGSIKLWRNGAHHHHGRGATIMLDDWQAARFADNIAAAEEVEVGVA